MSHRLTHYLTLALVALGFLAIFMVAVPNVSYAQGSSPPATAASKADAGDTNVGDPNNVIVKFLYKVVVTFFGWIAGMTGAWFDYAVRGYIVDFGSNFLGTGIGGIIDNLWTTVRDIFNLTFIFGLVYIGFQMILSNSTNAQRSLGYLIAAALLVNFSLFITKFIIDFSNLAATQIYNAFVFTGSSAPGASSSGHGIAMAFVKLVGLSTAFNADVSKELAAGDATFGYIFGLLLLLTIAAFVFGAGAIMIMIRYIALNLYMVFSPLLFLGWVFPQMAGFSRDYWRGFLKKAFFAPAFIFMLYLSYQVVASNNLAKKANLAESIGGKNAADVAQGGAESFAFFILAMGFMIASLVVAEKMGANGASAAISVGQNLRKRAQGLMFRPAGAIAKGIMNRVDNSSVLRNSAMGRTLQRTVSSNLNKVYNYGAGGTSLAKARSNTDSIDADIRKNRVRMSQEENSQRRSNATTAHLAVLEDNTADESQLTAAMTGLANTIRNMSNDERAELGHGTLTNHHVAANLTDAHITSLESSGRYSNDEINEIRAARRQAQINVAQTGFARATQTGTTDAGAPIMEAVNTAVRSGGDAAGHQDAQRRRLISGGTAALGNLPVDALSQPNMVPLVTARIVEERMRNGLSETDRLTLRDAILTHNGIAIPPAGTAPVLPPGSIWDSWVRTHPIYGAEFFR